MDEKDILWFTQENFDKETEKLNYLKGQKREEIVARIENARSFGDLSENAEYDEARKDQSDNEEAIKVLEARLAKAKIYNVEDTQSDNATASRGMYVKLLKCWDKTEMEIQLVGTGEADPRAGKIADNTPLGAGVSGKAVGESFSIIVPAGERKYKILGFSKTPTM